MARVISILLLSFFAILSFANEAQRAMWQNRITTQAVAAHCLNGLAEKYKGAPERLRDAIRIECGGETLGKAEANELTHYLTTKATALLEAGKVIPAVGQAKSAVAE